MLTLLFPRFAHARTARRLLGEALGREAAEPLIRRARVLYQPPAPAASAGLGLMLRYMACSAALYRALLEHGQSAAQAGAMVEAVNAALFTPASGWGYAATRLRHREPLRRVGLINDLLFRWLFTAPFQRRPVALPGAVAYEVTVCPLAAYFREAGLPALTHHAACQLDHHLARRWGMRLERSGTLAQGAAHCDFRFVPAPAVAPDAPPRAAGVEVTRAYQRPYEQPIAGRAGDAVQPDAHRRSEFPGWVWCTAADGRAGWTPRAWLREARGEWRLQRDFDAIELSVVPGERLEVLLEESGFYWVRRGDAERGWVPCSHVRAVMAGG
ncbi:MAG TPA: L-2-amino-thiazoline-4-carboxylic acid hydrolase [Nevskiaceae bacterium]|nr:L-2-amino-thiazoline-4-carboxylic acid hydrolase [Nevskiaceae bacterium]